MRKDEMTALINEELQHIPKGSQFDVQAKFRIFYNSMRKNDLKFEKSKEHTLMRCIDEVRKNNPFAQPKFDRDYFGIR
jgi:hypothetical protein